MEKSVHRAVLIYQKKSQDITKGQIIRLEGELHTEEEQKPWKNLTVFNPQGLPEGRVKHQNKYMLIRTLGAQNKQESDYTHYLPNGDPANHIWKNIREGSAEGYLMSPAVSCSLITPSFGRGFVEGGRYGCLILDVEEKDIIAVRDTDLNTPLPGDFQYANHSPLIELFDSMDSPLLSPQDILQDSNRYNEIYHRPGKVTGVCILSNATTLEEVKASEDWTEYRPFYDFAQKYDLPFLSISKHKSP
jgi:hypothetical protein